MSKVPIGVFNQLFFSDCVSHSTHNKKYLILQAVRSLNNILKNVNAKTILS